MTGSGGNPSDSPSSSKLWSVLFVVFVLLVLGIRALVFLNFSTQVIDSDQPYMWLGARDYAEGKFMEPRYYGQDYNTFMEALIAAPFLWLELPVYQAVPIASIIISLFPFLFAASYLFCRKLRIHAVCVLGIVLCLPVSYDMLCALPRGFTTGIFFTSFFIISLLNPHHMRTLGINTVLAVLAYFVSANSVLVSIPFLFYMFLLNYKSRWYYIITVLCVVLTVPVLYLIFDRFYKLHPDYVMNDLTLRYSTDYFGFAVSKFNKLFKQVSFFSDESSWPLFAALLLFAFLLARKRHAFFYALCLFVVFLGFSLCFGKTLDGTDWLFMSHSRMYLGIPILFVLMIPLINIKTPKRFYFLVAVPFVYGIYKSSQVEVTFKKHEAMELWSGVRLIKLEQALSTAKVYGEACHKAGADFLFVSNTFWMNTLLAYGGPALFDDYPATQEIKRDKRYWVREENKNRVIRKMVVVSSNFNLDREMPQGSMLVIRRLDDYGMHLIDNNSYTTSQLADLIAGYEN